MSHKGVSIAYLHPGNMEANFHVCLGRLVRFHQHGQSPHELVQNLCTEAGSGAVAAARNGVVQQFLTSDAEWLFWLDADMGFPPDALHRLLEAADPVERPIVGGLCFSSSAIDATQDELGAVRYRLAPTVLRWSSFGVTPVMDYERDTLMECDATGSACIVIHRSVFEKMAEHFDAAAPWYFRMVAEGLEWGEDVTFCMRAKTLGFPVYVHTGVKTSHKKTFFATEDAYDEQRFVAKMLRELTAAQEDSVISLLVPSRGRPDQLQAMWESAKAAADDPSKIELVVRFDDDDPTRLKHRDLPDATIILGPRSLLSECWNECYEKASGGILMHCGDDIRFRTQGWDTMVRSAFARVPDRLCFVHGDDGFQGANLGTHGFLHRRWVETVGYFVPPKFSSDFNDTWLTEVADRIGRRVYLPELLTEHLHPAAGKGEWDQTHQERLERHAKDHPEQLYAETEQERVADAAKLQAAIEVAA